MVAYLLHACLVVWFLQLEVPTRDILKKIDMSVSHKNADLWHIGLDTLNWDGSGDDRSYLSLSLSLC